MAGNSLLWFPNHEIKPIRYPKKYMNLTLHDVSDETPLITKTVSGGYRTLEIEKTVQIQIAIVNN